MLTGLSSVRAEALLKGGNVSPWDKQIFKELHQEMQETGGHSKVDVMRAWLVSVMVSSPSCLTVLPCLAMEEWLQLDTSQYCNHKSTCILFDTDL